MDADRAIRLMDFHPTDRRYTLIGGELVPSDVPNDAAGCSGLATWIRILPWKQMACAVFELDREAWLQLGEQRWCLTDGSTRMRRSFVAPYVRWFQISGRDADMGFYYWYRDIYDGYPECDILRYARWLARSDERLFEFVCRWRFIAANTGKITDEVVAAISDCVKRRISEKRSCSIG